MCKLLPHIVQSEMHSQNCMAIYERRFTKREVGHPTLTPIVVLNSISRGVKITLSIHPLNGGTVMLSEGKWMTWIIASLIKYPLQEDIMAESPFTEFCTFLSMMLIDYQCRNS